MHDDPAANRRAPAANRFTTAARRSPGRTAAGAGAAAVLVLVLTAIWGTPTRSEPAARAATTADHGPDDGGASSDTAPESTDGTGTGTDSSSGRSDGRALTPFDTHHPAISRLDKRLLKAVQEAARDARDDNIEFQVTSGWRSMEHQQRLLDEGIEKYGSVEKARQFVKPPEKSTHVSGKAVDIGPTDADDWLIRNGSDYGLCQVYSNEMWHFELLTTPGGTCPQPLTDAAG
ncbi:M15 family metallopeptidase [Streptomyces sp. ML-6]|uniref:M15 family metallopeptidase n=1 Tax=Streptomyces sp. ML-6 TaxID=2982693 RepID=UPI0024BFA775|nr:M15 family metallopeptidase [Streptomyces sp. ML-6]MDK0520116.1 M15 family metallopeptidase [Streptomyces sp. ML-6]